MIKTMIKAMIKHLIIAFWVGRTAATHATSLLCAELQGREPAIRERVAYLAMKRGTSPDELWQQILKGDAETLNVGEFLGPQTET